jgi:uncharacterized protein YraI
MKSTGKLFPLLSILFLILSTLACNLPTSAPTQPAELSPEDIAYTLVAQTQQAALTATATGGSSVSVTSTLSKPVVSVTTATNCRTGPSVNYTFLMVLQPGASLPVVGKYTPSNYWIITMPNGSTCWLLGTYAITQGDVSQLPEMTPPVLVISQPTSGGNNNSGNNSNNSQPASAPAAPSGVKASTSCPGGRSDLISWHAVDNATKYNIYKDGGLIQQITPAQAGGGLLLSWAISPGNVEYAINYGVAAVNSEGVSSISTAKAPGCP